MRYLAALLLLLNMLYLVFSLQPADQSGPGSEPESMLRNTGITLLSESGNQAEETR